MGRKIKQVSPLLEIMERNRSPANWEPEASPFKK
jgi:hypothetical protein